MSDTYDYHWNVPGSMALGANRAAGKHAPLQVNDDGHLEIVDAAALKEIFVRQNEVIGAQLVVLKQILATLERVTEVTIEEDEVE